MPPLVFPDNTVLCNFAAVNRLDLLEGWLRGRGRWAEAVAYESAQSAQVLPALDDLMVRKWLGEPIELDEEHAEDIERLRRVVFGGSLRKAREHLGEAQTCYLIDRVEEFRESWWITDDEDAYEYAVGRRITAYRTLDIMRHIVADQDIDAATAFTLMQSMAAAGRGLKLPASPRDLL